MRFTHRFKSGRYVSLQSFYSKILEKGTAKPRILKKADAIVMADLKRGCEEMRVYFLHKSNVTYKDWVKEFKAIGKVTPHPYFRHRCCQRDLFEQFRWERECYQCEERIANKVQMEYDFVKTAATKGSYDSRKRSDQESAPDLTQYN